MNSSPRDPEFSVIIPTRNRPADFERALHSVLAQRCRTIEVIVVDDGSEDQFKSEYDRIAKASPHNVHFLHLMQRGRGHGHCFARNQGVEAAIGRYICFLDDDDYWTDPDFLSRAQSGLNQYGADLYFANQAAVTHDGKDVPGLWLAGLADKIPKSIKGDRQVYPVDIDQLLQADGFAHMNCWVLGKSLFLAAGGMDEGLRYEPDLDIYMRVLDKAGGIVHDENIVALHNVPDPQKKQNASTANGKLQKLLFQLTVADKHLLHLSQPSLLKRARLRKGFLLKKIAESLAQQQRLGLASFYAREALAVLPTVGWALRTAVYAVRSMTAPDGAGRGRSI